MLLAPMIDRLAAAATIEETLRVGLRDLVALHGAEIGNIQMMGPGGRLVIVEAWNLTRAFLETFKEVDPGDGSACARALRTRELLFIDDVGTDAEFAPYAKFAETVPFKAVMSCPLITSTGDVVGMISVHSANDFRPTGLEISTAKTYAQKLADAIAARVPDRFAFAQKRAKELRRQARASR